MIDQNLNISIIIPVFNGERFIENAYNNVINQNLNDFEIIFVDNNSTDDSVAIIKKLALVDPRISLYFETKQGPAAARNKGLKHAIGKYIYFYDVDDTIFKGALLMLKSVLDLNPEADSVFGKTMRASEMVESIEVPKNDTDEIKRRKTPFWGLLWMQNNMLLGNPPAFLHKKSTVLKMGGFPENLQLGEDAFFHIKLGLEYEILHIDRHVCYYYRHTSSTVSKQNKLYPQKIFTYWPQYIKAFLPYYLHNPTPKAFDVLLYEYIYGSVAKMIVLTKGIKQRLQLKTELEKDIFPLRTPLILKPYLYVLVYAGNHFLYKVYFFYVLRVYIKFAVRFYKKKNLNRKDE